jgi:hypothetical protein
MREREIENGHMPLSSIKQPEFVPSWNRHCSRLQASGLCDTDTQSVLWIHQGSGVCHMHHRGSHQTSGLCATPQGIQSLFHMGIISSSHSRIRSLCVCSHTHMHSVIGFIKLPEFVALYASKHPLTHTHTDLRSRIRSLCTWFMNIHATLTTQWVREPICVLIETHPFMLSNIRAHTQ